MANPVEYHTTLNPKIWEHNRLKSRVRGALLRIAEDFKDFVEIPFDIEDIVITGGNANYNYTVHSDLDLHLITNYDNIECDRTAEELFDSKRLLYKKDYNIDIHGIPVELYVEDSNHPAVSRGSYSVLRSEWINSPDKHIPKYNQKQLLNMVDVWKTILQNAIKTGSLQSCRKAVQLLRTYRKLGLRTQDGEFSIPNLVYKSLRNDHTLKGMTAFVDRLHDQELSL